MTQDEIIRMAREAGLIQYVQVEKTCVSNALERFAALVAANEREKQAEQEPVGVVTKEALDGVVKWNGWIPREGTKLYTAPVRTKDLTDDEIYTLYSEPCSDREMVEFARAVIVADRELNK